MIVHVHLYRCSQIATATVPTRKTAMINKVRTEAVSSGVMLCMAERYRGVLDDLFQVAVK